jgi:hypothetical protein
MGNFAATRKVESAKLNDLSVQAFSLSIRPLIVKRLVNKPALPEATATAGRALNGV